MIVKESSKTFTPHEAGTFRANCVDVTEPQTRITRFGKQESFKFVFETEHVREDGSRSCIWSRFLSPSLHEKSNLRKLLKQWIGRDLTAEERQGFDTESLLGRSAVLTIVHEEADGTTYANIAAITPDKNPKPLRASGKYTRVKDRPPKEEGFSRGAGPAEPSKPRHEGWKAVVVHVGANKGAPLGDLTMTQVKALHERWIPTMAEDPTPEDVALEAALVEACDDITY